MKYVRTVFGFIGGTLVYVVARAVSGIVWPLSPEFMKIPENEAWFTFPALFICGFLLSAIFYFYARNSSEKTGMLIAKAGLAFLLTNTIQTQIETLYFWKAFPVITKSDMAGLFVAGGIFSLIFVPLCVLFFRGRKKEAGGNASVRDWRFSEKWWAYALAALAYVPLYLGFGMIAQMAPALKMEYAEWTADQTLITLLPLWQIVRGSLFAAIAALIFSLFPSRKKALVAGALSLSLFISGDLLIPNILMAPALRLVHFFEITASMIVYALIAGRLLMVKKTD